MRDAAQKPFEAQVGDGRVELDPGHTHADAHVAHAGVDLDATHQHREAHVSTGRVDLRGDQHVREPQFGAVPADLDPGLQPADAQKVSAGVDLGLGHQVADAQVWGAQAESCGDQGTPDTQRVSVAAVQDALLLILADALDDLERVRIATTNRIRSLVQVKGLGGAAGEAILTALQGLNLKKWRTFVATMGDLGLAPEIQRMALILEGLLDLEHSATLDLERTMRAHPLGAWVKRTIGVGEKQAARLLAAIGDPGDRPNPAKLWQYCGHGDPARSKQRKDNVTYAVDEDGKTVVILPFSPTAKMRTRLIAESCIKQGHSPFRAVYDRERAKWADRDTTDLHKHNHALRVVGKAMLLDLWREARDLRGDHTDPDTQRGSVPAELGGDQPVFDDQEIDVAAVLPSTRGVAIPNNGLSAASPSASTSGVPMPIARPSVPTTSVPT